MTVEVESRGRPATRKYLAKKDRAIGAAAHVLNATGVGGFSLAAVAERLDLHPASLGYYWRKDTLIAACLHDAIGRWRDMAQEALGEPTPAARVERFIRLYYDLRRRIRFEGEAPLAGFSELMLAGREVVADYTLMFRAIARLFKGSAYAPDTRAGARWARLIIEQLGWSNAWIDESEPEAFDRAASATMDILGGGLAAPGHAWPTLSWLDLTPPPADPKTAPREAFLNAATKSLNGLGYRRASVDKISAQLNLTKGAFYHHNVDKDDVVTACFQRSFDILREAFRRAADAPTAWERLAFAAATLATSNNAPNGVVVRFYALATLPPGLRERMRNGFLEVAQDIGQIVLAGMADGSVRDVDARVAGQMTLALINSSAYLWSWAPDVPRDDVVDQYLRPSLMGLFREA